MLLAAAAASLLSASAEQIIRANSNAAAAVTRGAQGNSGAEGMLVQELVMLRSLNSCYTSNGSCGAGYSSVKHVHAAAMVLQQGQ